MPFISSVRGSYSAIGRGARGVSGDDLKLQITGGTVTTAGGYRIHTFTGPGTLSLSSYGLPISTEVLAVAGGGGGGVWVGSGAGAGGMITSSAFSLAASTDYPGSSRRRRCRRYSRWRSSRRVIDQLGEWPKLNILIIYCSRWRQWR